MFRVALPVHCPSCGAEISWRHADLNVAFPCPNCGRGVLIARRYLRVLNFVSVGLATLIAYALGARGEALFGAAVLGYLPTLVVVIFITLRLFPPEVVLTGDYRGILYDSNVSEDRATPTSESPADPPAEHEMFEQQPEPWTLAGTVLRSVLVFVVLWSIWLVARPFVYRTFPEFNATRQGAPGFPLVIHIGTTVLSLTNESGEAWTCTATLGYTQEYASTFTLEPRQPRDVPYANFQTPGYTVDIDALRNEARNKIAVECSEESGITHSYDFR